MSKNLIQQLVATYSLMDPNDTTESNTLEQAMTASRDDGTTDFEKQIMISTTEGHLFLKLCVAML